MISGELDGRFPPLKAPLPSRCVVLRSLLFFVFDIRVRLFYDCMAVTPYLFNFVPLWPDRYVLYLFLKRTTTPWNILTVKLEHLAIPPYYTCELVATVMLSHSAMRL